MPSGLRRYLRRARLPILLILALTLATRLYHLDNPPLGIHSWRQSDTAAVARNFLRGASLLWPEIDWAGAGPARVEMEFPLYCWSTAALSRLTADLPTAGRLLAALGSVVTTWFLYRLTRLCLGRRPAFWAALLYAIFPTNIYYGRAIMPESWMLASSVIGIYGFTIWSVTGQRWPLVWSCAAVACACLLKLPTLYLGLPLLWLAWRRLGPRCMISPALWLYAACIFTPVAAWYLHAHAIQRETGLSFGISDSDKWATLAPLLSPAWYADVFVGKIAEDHLTWAGTPLAVVALLMSRRGGLVWLFHSWALAVLIYIFLVPVGNRAHEYYQLPLLLPLAPLMARACSKLARRRPAIMIALLAAIVFFSAVKCRKYLKTEDPRTNPDYALAQAVAGVTKPGDLVVVANGPLWGDPTVLYNADRKGWTLPIVQLDEPHLQQLRSQGAKYLVGLDKNVRTEEDRRWREAMAARYPTPAQPPGMFILRLSPE